MSKQRKEKTKFMCRFGAYQFDVFPLGLINALLDVLEDDKYVVRKLFFVNVYSDDVIIFSVSLEELKSTSTKSRSAFLSTV